MGSASRSCAVVGCLVFVAACSPGGSTPDSTGTGAGANGAAGTAAGGIAGSGSAGMAGTTGSAAGHDGRGGVGQAGTTGAGGRGGTGDVAGTGGTGTGGSTGAAGRGGTGGVAGTGGTGTGGAPGVAGRGGTSGVAGGTGGPGGATGNAGAGGNAGGAGAAGRGGSGGTGGSAGTSGAGGAPTTFVCNQVTAMTLTREWFEAGFQQNPGIVDARWQLKAREHGYITEWANPNSDFWNEMIESPCTNGSTNPDHVVLTVLSWAPACCVTQPEWDAKITAAINNFKAKYSALKRIDLMTVIRGPGNMLCPTPPAADETIVIPPELDAALAAAATKFPNFVFVAPKFEAPNCAAFSGGGPHLTTAGNTAVAKLISAAFVNLQ